MIKRALYISALVFIMVFIFSSCTNNNGSKIAVFAGSDSYQINGGEAKLKTEAVTVDGILFAPAGEIVKKMGGKAKINKTGSSVSLELGINKIETSVFDGDDTKAASMKINGKTTVCDIPPRLLNGEVMLPVAYIFEYLGCETETDANTDAVHIKYDSGIAFSLAPEGFGGSTAGAFGGPQEPVVLYVTSTEDEPDNPAEGTLRWAVSQTMPRVVRFRVCGSIELKADLQITSPYITIDGYGAPGDGITIKNAAVLIRGGVKTKTLLDPEAKLGESVQPSVHDVVLRFLRMRPGDSYVRGTYPTGGGGMDCISIDGYASDILVDRCSLSWSTDELAGILTGRNITFQWCIFSEPLGDASDRYEKTTIATRLHPYGKDHAYGLNASACTLSISHSLFAHSLLRMPNFESNDAVENQMFDVKMESVNNIVFDYGSNGGRYRLAVDETQNTTAQQSGSVTFNYHFIGNKYINEDESIPDILADMPDNGTAADKVKAFVSGNIGPSRPTADMDEWASVYVKASDTAATPITEFRGAGNSPYTKHMSDKALFESAVSTQSTDDAYGLVMRFAGASKRRDAVDKRILDDVKSLHYYREGMFDTDGVFSLYFSWADYPRAQTTYNMLKTLRTPQATLPYNEKPNPGDDGRYMHTGFTVNDFFGYGTDSRADDNGFKVVYNMPSPKRIIRSPVQVGGYPQTQTGKADLIKMKIKGGELYPYFNRAVSEYKIKLPSEAFENLQAGKKSSVSITPVTADEKTNIKLNGYPVKSGQEIQEVTLDENKRIIFTLTDNDGISQKYTLEFEPEETNADNK